MRIAVVNSLDNRRRVMNLGAAGFSIGRDAACDLQLDSKLVSRMHVRIDRAAGGWQMHVADAARNPVEVDREINGKVVAEIVQPAQSVTLEGRETIRVGNFLIQLLDGDGEAEVISELSEVHALIQHLHAAVLQRLDLRLGDLDSDDRRDERVEDLNRVLDDCIQSEFQARLSEPRLFALLLDLAVSFRLQLAQDAQRSDWAQKNFGVNPDMEREADVAVAKVDALFQTERVTVSEAVRRVWEPLLAGLRNYVVVSYIKKQLYDLMLGLGPLEGLLASGDVSEVMVVSPSLIYVEKAGKVVKSPQVFPTIESAISVIERIVAPLGRRIDRAQPLVDARLRDGSRVNAVIEPLAVKGPCITIRRFPKKVIGIQDLVDFGALTTSAVVLLTACVKSRSNMIVVGGTGSGKTTLLNALSSLISPEERLVTIEDAAELRLQQEHVVTLETRPPSAEGTGAYSTRDLVKNALRMRPDRIIVGECRGGEALDMLQAMNTGHSGSMTTLHANSAHDVPARLETMVLMAGELPLISVRRQIAEAIDFVVFIERLSNGKRMVTQISEVIGLHPQSGEIELRDVMRATNINGKMQLAATGFMPTKLPEMVAKGHLDLHKWFELVKA